MDLMICLMLCMVSILSWCLLIESIYIAWPCYGMVVTNSRIGCRMVMTFMPVLFLAYDCILLGLLCNVNRSAILILLAIFFGFGASCLAWKMRFNDGFWILLMSIVWQVWYWWVVVAAREQVISAWTSIHYRARVMNSFLVKVLKTQIHIILVATNSAGTLMSLG